ncbi:MAG: DUF1844 domain-containing protein [Thermodesulfobacteriota bacterium]
MPEEDKGFTVIDRRNFAAKDKSGETSQEEIKEEKPAGVDFTSFVLSFGTQAYIHFGDLDDPTTKKKSRDLPLAKQTIDVLGIIEEKTRGNLTDEEQRLLASLLYDLRMRYVEEISKSS